jgi:dephospho-CoA kinase
MFMDKQQPRYCLTGGIGSGKSYVCRLLRERGIEVFDCDESAKRCVIASQEVREQLTRLIGSDTYRDGVYNKAVVAQFLLASDENKRAINNIVHPAVMRDFLASGMQWMECAILYDSHLEHYADKVVAVVAPEEVRVGRIMRRDGITRQKAKAWIKAQMPQQEVEQRADYVIVNDGIQPLQPQIDNILNSLIC